MPSAERSVTINRPAAEVFAYVADGSRAMEWRSGVAETRLESGSGVGAKYMQRVRGPMRRRIKADYEITRFESGKKLEFKTISGPVRPRGGYRFSESDGKTKVTFWLDAELGRLKGLLMGRSVQRSMDAEMKALDKLKSVLEGGKADSKARAADSKAAPAKPTPAPSKAGAARTTAAKASTSKSSAANAAATAKPAAPRTARRKPKSS
jgi:uncharacterized membrane protein